MSKEELLISLLKSEQSIADDTLRNNFSKEEIKEIKKKIHKKEKIDKYFREQETKQEERDKKTRRTREKTLQQRIKKV